MQATQHTEADNAYTHTILKTPGVVKHEYGFYVVSGGTIHAGQAYDHWGRRTVTFTDGRVVANGSMWE